MSFDRTRRRRTVGFYLEHPREFDAAVGRWNEREADRHTGIPEREDEKPPCECGHVFDLHQDGRCLFCDCVGGRPER